MSKHVLLTGGGGAIGVHVVKWFLQQTNWKITIIDSYRHKGDPTRVANLLKEHTEWRGRVRVIKHDLCCAISPQMKREIGAVDYILHLAAMSDVSLSIENPVYCMKNNIDSTIAMLEYARETPHEAFIYFSTDEVYGPVESGGAHKEWDAHKPSNAYSASKAASEDLCYAYWRGYGVKLVVTNCWDMETRLFTTNGMKSFDEVKEGDLAWSIDDEGNLVTQEVLEKVRMEGPETMVRFKAAKVDQLVTPNHRMMIQRPTGKPRRWGNIEEAHASTFVGTSGRVKIPLAGEWIGTLDGFSKDYDPAWLAEIAGWYVSEGYPAGTEISFGAGTQHQVSEIQSLIKQCGYNSWCSGRSVRMSNKKLKEVMSGFGNGAENKQIPNWLINAPKDILRIFWTSAMKGDGAKLGTPGGQVYYTKSKKLAEQMCEVGIKIGYGVRISKRMTWNPKKTIKSESLIVRFRMPSQTIESRNVSEEPYNGDVWCVRVPNGRVFVERNGIISLTGQTMNNFGETQAPSKYPSMIQQRLANKEAITVHASNGEIGTRFYIHSEDVAGALLFILQNLPAHEHDKGALDEPDRYHIVGSACVDNESLVHIIANITGDTPQIEYVDFHSDNPAHDIHYGLQDNKLRAAGWHEHLGFDAGMKRCVEWEREQL